MITRIQSLLDFIKKHMLATYLTLIPSFILTIFLIPIHLRVLIFTFHVLLILISTYVMFREYEKEKELRNLAEEKKATKKLQVYLENLIDTVGNQSYIYSLNSLSIETSNDENIRKRGEAWSIYFRSFVDNFDMEANKLIRELENEVEFTEVFKKFQDLLSHFRIIKDNFYIMIEETKPFNDFTQDSDFKKIYKKLCDEHNKYMDKLGIFSVECEAQFDLKLHKKLIEHLKDLNHL